MEIGIDSFAAAFTEDSRAVNASDRLRNLIEQIEHADRFGLDSFGIGEHHRREFGIIVHACRPRVCRSSGRSISLM